VPAFQPTRGSGERRKLPQRVLVHLELERTFYGGRQICPYASDATACRLQDLSTGVQVSSPARRSVPRVDDQSGLGSL